MKSRCSVCGHFACICEWESRKKDALLDLENAKSATPNPSPGPTTTPVEKREEDVATDVVPGHYKIDGITVNVLGKAEPQPISNPLVCGRRQEAARELIQSWRTSAGDCRQLAIDYPKTGAIAVQRASVYLQCADNLEAALEAALLEEKS